MAKPRIFISSTYYDLKHLRSTIENFIETIGYEPVLSEKGVIAYMPDVTLDESCYREVKNADIYVLIIGGRYGSQASERKNKSSKDFFSIYDSITKLEYKSAVDQDIPIYILIEKSVYADYENWLRNRDNNSFIYAHVDSINIFYLIEEIFSQPRNNPIYQFDRYTDMESWLKEQWAGLLKELLKRMSNQQQIKSLSNQIFELSENNKTLKLYLESLMTKVAPADSEKLITAESKRLEELKKLSKYHNITLFDYLMSKCEITSEVIFDGLDKSINYYQFLDYVKPFVKRIDNFSILKKSHTAILEFNEMQKVFNKDETENN